ELGLLEKALQAQLAHFSQKPDAAKELLAVGKAPVSDHDPAELAAYANVARIILNLSEFITRN
ncbi:MAG: hypothetical protein HKN23_02200, partial [Verrucomicrobiales bacterium]|nr:hypothetical protein [Verrucomicrobiales bacterium]